MIHRLLILSLLLTLAACTADVAPQTIALVATAAPAPSATPAPLPTAADAAPRELLEAPVTATPLPAPVDAGVTPTSGATTVPPTPTDAAPVVAYGQTAEGAFFQGVPGAPVRLIDYSDYL